MRGLYPSQPMVGVGALVIRNGSVLLVRRAAPPDKGLWAIPGGKVELGEGVCSAAARELQEETSLSCKPKGVVNVDEIITFEGASVKYHYVLITVLMDDCAGSVRPASDALDAAFFNVVEASQRSDVAESTRGFLRKVIEGRAPLSNPIKVFRSSPP